MHASVGEVEILKVGKITELRRHHNTVERIPAEIEMLQVSQREQRSWYLAFKKCSTRALEYWVIQVFGASTKDAIKIAQIAGSSRGWEIEPDHMAGDVAAPDTSPAAAVMVLFPPRHQPACGIACDGSLERQQRVPLARYAARGSEAVVCLVGSVVRCTCTGDEEEAAAGGGGDKQQQQQFIHC